ncbi:MAG: restriction endonuclease subunit S [bacterium]|nr:restriction endonuclease subunit S [bacterium]
MQISVVNKSALVGDLRLDAEAYLPLFFDIERHVRRHTCTTLKNESSLFVKGIFDIKAECYLEKGGVPFVRIGNLKDMLISENDIINIPEEENNKNKKTYLKRGDIILSKTAYPAASFVNLGHCNTSQDTIAIKLKNNSKINSHFLVLFLNSKYGFLQMKRWFTGNIQMHLNLTDSKNIEIPIYEKNFQEIVKKIFEKAINQIELSKKLYRQAEQILLSELELLDWKPKHRLSFAKKFSETKSADRIDAEYFQPMYEETVKHIKQYKNGYKLLGELIKIKGKNFLPKSNMIYKYIELANISTNGNITGFTEALGKDLPTRARQKVNTGDIIVSSIEGSLSSIALIADNLDNALCSTGFFVINSDVINSETVLVLFKSIVGQLQLKKGCSGTILTAISKDEFLKIVLPNVSKVQDEIKSKITEMYNAKRVSQKLLDIAKRGVELAIEQSESEAEKWIKNELAKLEINL